MHAQTATMAIAASRRICESGARSGAAGGLSAGALRVSVRRANPHAATAPSQCAASMRAPPRSVPSTKSGLAVTHRAARRWARAGENPPSAMSRAPAGEPPSMANGTVSAGA